MSDFNFEEILSVAQKIFWQRFTISTDQGEILVERVSDFGRVFSFMKIYYDTWHTLPSLGYEMAQQEKSVVLSHVLNHRLTHNENFLFYELNDSGEKKDFIGWCIGERRDCLTFYMRNTAISPSWRGKGIYTNFTHHFIKYIANLGYQRIESDHHPNSQIVKLKQKLGFIKSGESYHESYGHLLQFTYFTNDDRKLSFISQFPPAPLKP